MRLVGVIDGEVRKYSSIIKNIGQTVQLGDFHRDPSWASRWMKKTDLAIRGNKDPEWSGFLPSGSMIGDIFFIGCDGVDWIEKYCDLKPLIVASHYCPTNASRIISYSGRLNFTGLELEMDVAMECHKPETWVFSHWKQDRYFKLNGTRMVSLNREGWIDL